MTTNQKWLRAALVVLAIPAAFLIWAAVRPAGPLDSERDAIRSCWMQRDRALAIDAPAITRACRSMEATFRQRHDKNP